MQTEKNFRIIRNARRKHIAFRFAPDGVLEILSPPGVPESFLSRLPVSERAAIEKLRQRSAALTRKQCEVAEGTLLPLLGKYYPLHLSSRLRLFDGERFIVPRGSREEIISALTAIYREIAGRVIFKRCQLLEESCQLHPAALRISGADTRWGSCNSRKEITFSWKLVQCPAELIDYVIIHELAHLVELNHSPRFWQIVKNFAPRFQELKKQLRNFSHTLPQL